MKFRLVTTKWTNASKILKDYPQLINKIEVTDGNAYITVERAEEFMELAKKMPSRGRNAKGAFYTNIRWTEYALELRGGTMKQYNFDDFKEG